VAGAVTDHVVILSIDGLRADAIEPSDAPTLQRLVHEGAVASVAQTIVPSTTLPAHTSMLTGLGPSEHGVTWNSEDSDPSGTVGVPTIFEIAHAHRFETAAFVSKSKFRYLERRGSLDYSETPSRGANNWPLARTVANVERFLTRHRPNLLFVHFGEPDYAGHSRGWMTPVYARAIADVDVGVARVLSAADRTFGAGDYTLIVTSDHGGHGRIHGTGDPQDLTIPWFVWGKGVAPGTTLADTVRTMDTAATVLWLLGLAQPAHSSGHPQSRAFTPAAQVRASEAAHQ
jgi:predicted AlkP superfamily pyrophosphatase or phosphodiesterase